MAKMRDLCLNFASLGHSSHELFHGLLHGLAYRINELALYREIYELEIHRISRLPTQLCDKIVELISAKKTKMRQSARNRRSSAHPFR